MIYLLEDDSAIRELVVYTLCSTGLEATGFAAPSEFYDAMERALPELLILDIMLPELDGLEVLTQLRRAGIETPVLMLTARSSVEDRIRGLDHGADRYSGFHQHHRRAEPAGGGRDGGIRFCHGKSESFPHSG